MASAHSATYSCSKCGHHVTTAITKYGQAFCSECGTRFDPVEVRAIRPSRTWLYAFCLLMTGLIALGDGADLFADVAVGRFRAGSLMGFLFFTILFLIFAYVLLVRAARTSKRN
jgi:hypothetical protein